MADDQGDGGRVGGLEESARIEPERERAAPVAALGRIASIDVLRGFALLGILVMNIPFFGLTSFAMFDPRRAGGFEGLDYATWLGGHLLFDMKMMSIFSMLFGAGLVLFAEKAVSKTGRAAGLHYRRMLWLLLIGMVHAYLVWEGDILVWYALCGMIVYPLRFVRARWLVVIAVLLMAVAPVINTGQGYMFDHMRDHADRLVALEEAGEEVPEEVEGWGRPWLGEYDTETGELIEKGVRHGFYPDPEQVEEEREAVLGSPVDRIRHRAEGVFFMQTYLLIAFGVWRVCGMMVLGMALFKWGVLSATRSWGLYGALAVLGFGLGLPIVGAGVSAMHRAEFDAIAMFKHTWNFNNVGSILVAFGWIGLVMLLCKAEVLGPVRAGLAAVGRMAFTNYLMQSVLCGAIFFGWGLGRYGDFSRSELIPIVLGVWAFLIVFSLLWLRAFRFGPMEWVWRSLTYWSLQPMRRRNA